MSQLVVNLAKLRVLQEHINQLQASLLVAMRIWVILFKVVPNLAKPHVLLVLINLVNGQSSCKEADPGYYVPIDAQSIQTACFAGTYNPYVGASSISVYRCRSRVFRCCRWPVQPNRMSS